MLNHGIMSDYDDTINRNTMPLYWLTQSCSVKPEIQQAIWCNSKSLISRQLGNINNIIQAKKRRVKVQA